MIFVVIGIGIVMLFGLVGFIEKDFPLVFLGTGIAAILVPLGQSIAASDLHTQDVTKRTVQLQEISSGIYASFAEGNKIVVRYNGSVKILPQSKVTLKNGKPQIEILDYRGNGTWTYVDADDHYVITIPQGSLSY